MNRSAKLIAAAAATAALLVPAGTASADETLVNFVGPKKLKVSKKIDFNFVCRVQCSVTVRTVLKGPKFKDSGADSGTVPAATNIPFVNEPNGPLLKAMKAEPGKFKLAATVTATDPLTGETDTDRRSFKFKK